MNSEEGFLMGMVFAAGLALVVSWGRQWRELRRLRKRVAELEKPAESARFQRLEQAVDAIAMEVERVSNAQRVVAQMLNPTATMSRLPERQSTPH